MQTETNIEYKVIRKISIEDYFDVTYFNNGIAEVIWSEKIDVVEIPHIIKIQDVMKDLGNGENVLIYTVSHSFMSISKDASKFSESSLYTKANAVLIDELGKRLLFNFFVMFTKQRAPIKGFDTREDAFKWLLSL